MPQKDTATRALAPEVIFLGPRPFFAARKDAEMLVDTKKIAWNQQENRTSGAEPLSDCILYGTAEAVPFVLV